MGHTLTKSKYTKGLQCEKALYLDAYKRHLGRIDDETRIKFEQGRKFEAGFKGQFPDGMALDKLFEKKIDKYVEFTAQQYKLQEKKTIFEAGFIHDDVLVLTDVLIKEIDGTTTVYEIKNVNSLTDVIKADAAIQYYVLRGNDIVVDSFNVVLNDGNDGYSVVDVTDFVESHLEFVRANVERFKKVLQGDEPQIAVGEYCSHPYECEFRQYCEGKLKSEVRKENVEGIELDQENPEFNQALDFVLKTNKPLIYLTGKAGTGKTTFLKTVRAKSNKNMVILAPTGVAAVNAGGQTIHSFFKIAPSPYVPGDKRLRKTAPENDPDKSTIYDHFQYNNEKRNIIRNLELLIIDEVSMARCDLLDVIDCLLRVFRNSAKPFGGVQVLLIGDTFQLPPVAKPEDWNTLSRFYSSVFFFSSKVIEANECIYIELKKIYRQTERDFIDLLNRVRVARMSEEDYRLLDGKFDASFNANDGEQYISSNNQSNC